MTLTPVAVAIPVTAAVPIPAVGILTWAAMLAVPLRSLGLRDLGAAGAAEQRTPQLGEDARLARGLDARSRRGGGGRQSLHHGLLGRLARAFGARHGNGCGFRHQLVAGVGGAGLAHLVVA